MKKNFLVSKSKSEILVLMGVFLLCLIASFNLLRRGYFSMHDDIQVMRLMQMEKCFLDGQIPCRWVPDMGANYGYPLFNYYSVLPYYLGIFFRLFGFSLVGTIKILFTLSFFLSGFLTYFLIREFYGRSAGLVGAAFYLFAPYHAVDVYVRGALSESWAMVFFPLIFLSLYKYVKEEKLSWFLLSLLGLSGLFLSHNIMTLLFLPLAFSWSLFWVFFLKKIKILNKVLLIFLWSFLLSAFFILPSFLEKSLVRIDFLTSDYYNFRNHFATLKQLFIDRSFDYGPSRPGPQDDLSFQIGWPHWWVAVLSGVLGIISLLKKRSKERIILPLIFLLWFFFTFMTHAKSVLFWEAVPLLTYVQFPWRLLAVVMFLGAFLAGGFLQFFKVNNQRFISLILILIIVFLNIKFFSPEHFYPNLTDQKILSGESWQEQSRGALLDYLPKQVEEIPKTLAPAGPWVIQGEAKITEYAKRSDFWRFSVEVLTENQADIRVPIFDFPRWEVFIDQEPVFYKSNNPQGVITFSVASGKHTVVGWFRNTPLREMANLLTVISFAALLLLVVFSSFNDKKIV